MGGSDGNIILNRNSGAEIMCRVLGMWSCQLQLNGNLKDSVDLYEWSYGGDRYFLRKPNVIGRNLNYARFNFSE